MAIRQRQFWNAAAATAAVVGAVLCRVVVRTTQVAFLENLANFVRFFLYFGLFAFWGASVRQRVMQTQVRGYLVAVAVLMVLWLTLRELRWHIVLNPDVRRWMWYLYYVPLLLIPLLALLVSLSLGRSEQFRLPRQTSLLYAPTVLLILLALSNDAHQWMFTFPDQAAMQTELDYRYGALYYVVCAWIILSSAAAFLAMLAKCRIPRTKKIIWMPLVPFGAAVLYAALYALRVPFVVNELGDLAMFDRLIFAAFFRRRAPLPTSRRTTITSTRCAGRMTTSRRSPTASAAGCSGRRAP